MRIHSAWIASAATAILLAALTRSTRAAFIASLVLIMLDELFGKIVRGLSRF